jgi:hypothetical protein
MTTTPRATALLTGNDSIARPVRPTTVEEAWNRAKPLKDGEVPASWRRAEERQLLTAANWTARS